MKQLFKTFVWALTALTTFAGCRQAEQELPEAASLKTVRFQAGAADTRTAFAAPENGVYRTLWTENDSDILLSMNYGKAVTSAVTPSEDGETAWFEASFDAADATSPYTFYAVSPASAARAISPSRSAWSVYVAADQKPLENSVDEAAQLLVAKSAASAAFPEKVDLHFGHLTAYGRLSLKNLELEDATVSKVELTFSTPVVGEWYWAEDGTLTSNGASHTITLDTDASGDLWFACAPVDVSGQTLALSVYTDHGILSKEISFPEGRKFTSGKVARFSVDMAGITFGGGSDQYVRVTDVSEIHVGDELLIVNTAGTYALGGQVSTGTAHRSRVAVTTENGVVTDRGQATPLTVETGSQAGTWSFHTGSGYLSSASSKNVLKESKSKDAYSSWTVTVSGGVATIAAQSGDSRYIRENTQSPRFSCYKQGTQNDVVLYKKSSTSGAVHEDPLVASSEYGSYYVGAAWTYERGVDQLFRSYPDGKLEFVLLKASTKEQLVVSGYDPSLTKGDAVTVSLRYRKGRTVLMDRTCALTVVREDGPKVWLGDGSGQGFILKK
jgi:hypothetical protein